MTRPRLDIDQLLIFFLLIVTVSQLAAYLDRYTGIVLAYLQAVAIDAAIWRCSFWYKRYGGRKQRRLALLGLLAFSLVSAWYNRNYYAMRDAALPSWQAWLMGAILPVGVALLSYLYGTKDESRFGHAKDGEGEPEKAEPLPFACKRCGRRFGNRNGLNAHQKAHKKEAMNG